MVGAAETITTPATKGKEVHDDLYARALVLAKDDMRFVVVTYDGIGMSIDSNNNLRRAISRAIGIPVENIAVNCSHGHTAPGPSADTWERDKQPSTVDESEILYDEWLGKDERELTYGRWFLGHTVGTGNGNVELRTAQYRGSFDETVCVRLARGWVQAKIRNSRVLLRRNWRGDEDPGPTLRDLRRLAERAGRARDLPGLLGSAG